MLEVVCPGCAGAKELFDRAGEFGCGCQLGRRICQFCHGAGTVRVEAYEHWREAQARAAGSDVERSAGSTVHG